MPWMRSLGALYGPASLIGLVTALAAASLDQASKLWLLQVYRLGEKGRVVITPVLDLHLTWNAGISYGLLQQSGIGRWILLAVSVAAVLLLWVWLARSQSRLSAIALGLIIGGAVGNAIDRFIYGAVADFVLFHIGSAASRIDWYVFNLADCAIVAGVVGLLYDALFAHRAAKAP
jgi:signal peptidase II